MFINQYLYVHISEKYYIPVYFRDIKFTNSVYVVCHGILLFKISPYNWVIMSTFNQ